MAKSSRGGKRGVIGAGGAGGAGGAPAGTGTSGAVQVDDTQQAQAMGASYAQFQSMTDDQKADYIDSMATQPVPAFLSDSAFQRFTYNSDMNDVPQLVDDKTLDSMGGTELFRNVNASYNRSIDVGYKADEIAAQIQKGSITRYSDSGGSVYGRGLYFADDYGSSAIYGNTSKNVKATAVVRCKLNSNAKAINYSSATAGMRSEIASGSKLGNSLKKIARTDSDSAVSIFALSKGYNVITSGHGYFNILNRNAVTMSKEIHAKGSQW